MKTCPCCSQKDFLVCCGPFLAENKIPATPEQLMRSRYTAYAMNDFDYIRKTMKSPAADDFNPSNDSHLTWLKLDVLSSDSKESKGRVEYIAYYSYHGELRCLHEKSTFRRDDNQWYYIDGEQLETNATLKIGRNFPCICGSGKKFKKCCEQQQKSRCGDHNCTHHHH